MTLVVVRSKTDEVLAPDAFADLAAAHERLLVDVGAGDGRGAYALAKSDPAALVVAFDTAADNLRETAARAARKPARGGLANLVLLRASAEDPPAEIVGRADEVHVTLPWGVLLVGVVEATAPVLPGVASLLRPGGRWAFTLNCEIWSANTPADLTSLVEATPGHLWGLADRYEAAGLRIDEVRYLTDDELAAMPSTWARRLLRSRDGARFLLARGTKVEVT
jgi:16S rRNA (adenine(1408)-N(1))-methyltransferase